MADNGFDRDAMAKWYAEQHFKTDPGIREIFYLPSGSPEREIRFLEVNTLLQDIDFEPLEPIDFIVDTGKSDGHTLFVLDVTPNQLERIRARELLLPKDWSLNGFRQFTKGI